MGCDVHMVVEIRYDSNSPWVKVGRIFKSWDNETLDDEPYSGRSYRFFSVLAGVRNFGHKPPITPIAEPRGFPEDASPETKDYLGVDDTWGSSYHSMSWLTAEELINHHWPEYSLDMDFIQNILWVVDTVQLSRSASDVRIVFGFDS